MLIKRRHFASFTGACTLKISGTRIKLTFDFTQDGRVICESLVKGCCLRLKKTFSDGQDGDIASNIAVTFLHKAACYTLKLLVISVKTDVKDT